MKIVASILVRMNSTRLPGKVMKSVGGKPALQYLLDRLAQSNRIDEILVATSTNKENDLIYEYCQAHDIFCYRGAEDDVLNRLLCSLKWACADIGVVVFGDNPLIDARIVDHLVDLYLNENLVDFLGNDLVTTYPPGMEVEVFDIRALEDADRRAVDMSIREHATLYIRKNKDLYNVKNVEAPQSLRRPNLYLGLDTEEDYVVVNTIAEQFRPRIDYSLSDIISLMDGLENLSQINRNVHRKWQEYREDG